ncbi:MAG: hypothetical protein AAF066_05115 [Pseudomonadota bacterium]
MAQTVSVVNGFGEQGYGWMFRHNRNCFVAMPRHVVGSFSRVSLTTAAPVTTGTGTVILPFWEGIDLALAVARGGLEPRCVQSLDALDLSSAQAAATSAQLLRLSPTGEEVRDRIAIQSREYLTFEGALTDGKVDIGKGTSGAFVFAQGAPLGMAITSEDGARATFMRSEEIYLNLSRYLAQQSGAYIESAAVEPAVSQEAERIALRLESSSVPPVNPQYAPENMIGEGVFVFAQARRMEFVFQVEAGKAVSLSRLRITAPPDAGYVLPKTVLIQTSTGATPSRFRRWLRDEMPPDGILDTGQKAARNARWVKVTVLDAWGPGPVAIDAVLVD